MPALVYQVEKFEGVKRKGTGTDSTSLSNNVLRHVMRETSAIVIWRKLEEIYSKATLTGRLYLKRLFHCKMKEGGSLQEHVQTYQKILADLENIEVKIEEEDKAMILCCSLPSSLEHFVDTLLYGKTTITLSEVVNAMLSKDERMKATVVEEYGQGLVARGRNMDRTSSNKKWRSKSRGKSKGSIVCFGCKQTGYKKKECPNRKGKYEKREDTFRGHNGDDNSSGEMLVVTSSGDDSSQWVMDSGCTFHMCPRLDWFSTLDEIQGGKVLMGNDGECEVKGIGNIRLRTHDGQMHTLTDVRYVPEITKNLISLGALDARGYRISITGRFMRVLKESLVIMKAEKQRNLYFMLGEVVVGSANVSSSVVAGKEDSPVLWHMRLGHMGERRMTALGRQGMLGDTQLGSLPFSYAYVRQGKLEPRSLKCIFLGYGVGVKGYRLWYPLEDGVKGKGIISRDVVFDEASVISLKKEMESTGCHTLSDRVLPREHEEQQRLSSKVVTFQLPTCVSERTHGSSTVSKIISEVSPLGEEARGENVDSISPDNSTEDNIAMCRTRREIRPPARYAAYAEEVAYALKEFAEEKRRVGERAREVKEQHIPKALVVQKRRRRLVEDREVEEEEEVVAQSKRKSLKRKKAI
ncbi:hypothetical protein MLD38_005807 [Melastoma candidum]|uniref:Uncharacterized protein n=1 Tax=Melastoma candidum TaxID=119954 RepID=A0ACB9RKU9_9MYRT|nr:hypothetical protein MLD38_005807 [Melastoma candidum]